MENNQLRNDDDVELASLTHAAPFRDSDHGDSGLSSLRSSLEDNFYQQTQDCTVHVHDDLPFRKAAEPADQDAGDGTPARTTISSPNKLRECLDARDAMRTRWIASHLGNHNCLGLENLSKQMLGGPTTAPKSSKFIWLQAQLWFVGKRSPIWASLRQLRLRMVICLPTTECAGTLITNFLGPFRLADEISNVFTERLIEDHPMGRQSLGCAWVLAFTFLRTMAEQLDFAFELFDPIESSSKASFSRASILNDLNSV
ncbi:MAG: hypothetical protein Q9191_002606 [Dirinaria sp. TL-2023a]